MVVIITSIETLYISLFDPNILSFIDPNIIQTFFPFLSHHSSLFVLHYLGLFQSLYDFVEQIHELLIFALSIILT